MSYSAVLPNREVTTPPSEALAYLAAVRLPGSTISTAWEKQATACPDGYKAAEMRADPGRSFIECVPRRFEEPAGTLCEFVSDMTVQPYRRTRGVVAPARMTSRFRVTETGAGGTAFTSGAPMDGRFCFVRPPSAAAPPPPPGVRGSVVGAAAQAVTTSPSSTPPLRFVPLHFYTRQPSSSAGPAPAVTSGQRTPASATRSARLVKRGLVVVGIALVGYGIYRAASR